MLLPQLPCGYPPQGVSFCAPQRNVRQRGGRRVRRRSCCRAPTFTHIPASRHILACFLLCAAEKGEAAWRRARSAEELLPCPNFYAHVPSRTDPTAAPADGDSIMALLPVANMQESATGQSCLV